MTGITPPPIQRPIGSFPDQKTGEEVRVSLLRDWSTWISRFFERIAFFLDGGTIRFTQVAAFVVGDTTPSVVGGNWFKEVNTGATNITAFDGIVDGQVIHILFTTGNTTIKDGTNLQLAGSVDFVGTANDVLTLIADSGKVYEVCRSVN